MSVTLHPIVCLSLATHDSGVFSIRISHIVGGGRDRDIGSLGGVCGDHGRVVHAFSDGYDIGLSVGDIGGGGGNILGDSGGCGNEGSFGGGIRGRSDRSRDLVSLLVPWHRRGRERRRC
jgi:hypothetical protein